MRNLGEWQGRLDLRGVIPAPVERGGKINRTGFGYLTPAAFANTCASRRLRPVGLALGRKQRSIKKLKNWVCRKSFRDSL